MGKRRFAVTGSGDLSVTDVSRYDSKGVTSHTRGWDFGIKVVASIDKDDEDTFAIYITGGSNEPNKTRHVMTLKRGDERE